MSFSFFTLGYLKLCGRERAILKDIRLTSALLQHSQVVAVHHHFNLLVAHTPQPILARPVIYRVLAGRPEAADADLFVSHSQGPVYVSANSSSAMILKGFQDLRSSFLFCANLWGKHLGLARGFLAVSCQNVGQLAKPVAESFLILPPYPQDCCSSVSSAWNKVRLSSEFQTVFRWFFAY
jgi:hypothetical protein